ncbi:MAG TPA: prolyl oligopeptidase family serine peptidase [Chlamydiales bacterium]|nr:prolyl oligopeptidase family serine peptidase [Chlamydiales bacterium]
MSRGASTAAMISSRYDGLAFQILIAGKYDYTEPFSSLFKGIQKQYVNEGEENWLDRSALFHADTTHIPTLILHGKLDPVHPFSTAQKYHDALFATGIFSRLSVYPRLSHFLVGHSDVLPELISFIRERFYKKSGIGVRLSPMQGYPQIAEFLSGFPAEKSNLQLGDMILSVSPNNDEKIITTYRMSMNEVSKLIVGEKGTALRLKVVHLEGIEEEVVIKRMESFQ